MGNPLIRQRKHMSLESHTPEPEKNSVMCIAGFEGDRLAIGRDCRTGLRKRAFAFGTSKLAPRSQVPGLQRRIVAVVGQAPSVESPTIGASSQNRSRSIGANSQPRLGRQKKG